MKYVLLLFIFSIRSFADDDVDRIKNIFNGTLVEGKIVEGEINGRIVYVNFDGVVFLADKGLITDKKIIFSGNLVIVDKKVILLGSPNKNENTPIVSIEQHGKFFTRGEWLTKNADVLP